MAVAVERMPTHLGTSFKVAGGRVQKDVEDLISSDQKIISPRSCHNLATISNGIAHIKLDNELLQSSKDWGTKFDPAHLSNEQKGNMCLYFQFFN